MPFDLTDPYDAASFVHCFLLCESCRELQEPPRAKGRHPQFSLEYYHEQAQLARAAGWVISPSAAPEGLIDHYDILCAACAKASGRSPAEGAQRWEPPEGVRALLEVYHKGEKLPPKRSPDEEIF